MTGRIEQTSTTGPAKEQREARGYRKVKKAEKYMSDLRPEDDNTVLNQGAVVSTPTKGSSSKGRKPNRKPRRHRRQQNKRKSLARASSTSTSSVDSDRSTVLLHGKSLPEVNLDAVDRLATVVVSSTQEENPVSSENIRRQLADIVEPETNPYRGSKRSQQKRSSSWRRPKRHATVQVKEFQFVPRSTPLQPGGTVTFVVDKNASASFALDGIGEELVRLESGQKYTHTFESQGVFRFMCTLQTSMVGRINVVSPESSHLKPTLLDASSEEKTVADNVAPTRTVTLVETKLTTPSSTTGVELSKRQRRKPKRNRPRKTQVKPTEKVIPQERSSTIVADCFDVSSATKFLRSRWRTAVVVL